MFGINTGYIVNARIKMKMSKTSAFLKRYQMLRLNITHWEHVLSGGRRGWRDIFVVVVVVVVGMTTNTNVGLKVCALLRRVGHYLLPRQCHGVGVTPVTIHVTISHHVTKSSGPRGYL